MKVQPKYILDSRDPEEIAEEKGCYVVYPASSQLQLDIDNDEAYAYFVERMQEVEELYDWVAHIKDVGSKSGKGHRHITISVQGMKFNQWERIALQNMLGSDPVREAMNAMRVLGGYPNPCRLFEPKEEKHELIP